MLVGMVISECCLTPKKQCPEVPLLARQLVACGFFSFDFSLHTPPPTTRTKVEKNVWRELDLEIAQS